MSNRISERNRIKTRVRDIESFIRFNTNAIHRLKQGSSNIDFCKTRIEKLKKDNDGLEQELKELIDRQEKLALGDLDKELSQQKRTETAIANKKTKEKRQKKLDELADKANRSKISKDYWDKTLKAGREARYQERSSKRGYDYVLRVHQSLPQYIRANLANMPNNKGYIWRGIHYYGLKDPEKDQHLVMFENKKGQLHIHEWSNDYLTYVLTVKQKKQSGGEIVRIKRFTKKGFRRVLVSDEIPRPGQPNPLKSRHFSKRKSRSRSRKRSASRKNPRNNGVKRTPPSKQKPRNRNLTPAEARERSRGQGKRSNHRGANAKRHREADAKRHREANAKRHREAVGRSRKKNNKREASSQSRREASSQSRREASSQSRGGGRGFQGRARDQKHPSNNQTTQGAGRGRHRTRPAWMDKK